VTSNEAIEYALAEHPDCSYGTAENGLDFLFNPTWVIKLWRNEECYLADDPPRYTVQGLYKHSTVTVLDRSERSGKFLRSDGSLGYGSDEK
jgi:hypothetical protein